METEDAALWRAVVEDPYDDAPRLIYADWLEENGAPERAEFVRVQCRLSRTDDDAPDRGALDRERQLWQKHRATWRAALPARLRAYSFRRGFVYPHNVHLTPEHFARLGDSAFDRAPLWDVRAVLRDPSGLTALAESDRARRLGGLELDCSSLESGLLADFLAAPGLQNVRDLRLRGGLFTPDHARALAASPALGRLTGLSVFSNTLGPAGAEILAGAEGISRLESLELVHCNLGDAGLRTLLSSPRLRRLRELRVPHNGLTVSAVRALVECRHLRALRVLDLQGNQLDDDGARVLALCPHVDRLVRLDLGLNRIRRPGAEFLAQSPFLARVRHLSLTGNPCAYDPATITGLRFRFSDRVSLADR